MGKIVAWVIEAPRFTQGMLSGTVVGLLIVALLQFVPSAGALSLDAQRDCNPNAVINCGALTTGEIASRYHNTGVPAIYDYFGIKATDINTIGTTALAGEVSKAGTVTVDGKVVATGAMTAGRQDIPGSAKITHNGVTFYARPPKVSFSSNQHAAYVVIKNGQFAFAILASCGNPVIGNAAQPPAKPKPVVKTPVTPQPTQPTQTPTPTPTVTTAAAVSQPESAPSPAPAAALPSTGPGDVFLVLLCAIAGGSILHFGYGYWRLRRPTAR